MEHNNGNGAAAADERADRRRVRGRRTAASPRALRLLACLAVAAALVGGEASLAQEEPARAEAVALPADGESPRAFREAVAGREAAAFATQPLGELEIALAPMPVEEVQARADAAIDYLREVGTALSETLIRYQRLDADGLSDEERAELISRATLLKAFATDLAARASRLLTAAEDKGADVEQARLYSKAVTTLEVPKTGAEQEAVPTPEQLARQAIRAVREEPPVHERAEPWNVSVTELELELQPLQKEALNERVDAWLLLLQRQVRERVRAEIALQKNTDQSLREALAQIAADQQAVVQATVARLQAALKLLARRGVDTKAYSDYITNATGQRIDVTDPSVFYAQAKAWATSSEGGVKLGLNVLKFVAVLLVFWLISRAFGAVVSAAVRRLPQASSLLHDFLVGSSRRVTLIIGLLIAATELGINITPLAAAIGAAGLVIGLSLQGTLSNFASGILILIYRPFDVGDVINAGGVSGKVDAMTLVSTRVLTFDNQVNLVPNNAIWNNVITNATALSTRRVDLTVGIGYADDMAHAQTIIEDTVKAHPKVLESPAPTIKVHELGDSSVNFIVRPWSKTSDYWEVFWDLTRQIKERFDAEGINIPFPQRDLHLAGPVEVVMAGAGGRQRGDAADAAAG